MSDDVGPKHDPLLGKVIADRYRIERELGHGGMGSVYLAQHVRMEKRFAVKLLHPEMSYVDEAVLRFRQEAAAAGRVDHEHLVSATDFGELEDGSLYLVLEYVDGRSLSELIAEGPLPAAKAVDIGGQIAGALAAAHAAGIVHRDVKPDNVMIVDRDGADFVKLLDFGMAKVQMDRKSLSGATQVGAILGTPRYMSPEQASGLPVDARSDLYSLGIVLYAMLTGMPPFRADDVSEILRMHREDAPPPMPQGVDPGLARVVMQLLAKNPGERFASARELAEALSKQGARLAGPRRARRAFFPRGLQLAGVGALVALGVSAFWLTRRGEHAPVPAATPAASVAAPDIRLERLLAKAEVGDDAAWSLLEARAEERSAREWLVLGLARTMHGKRSEGLEAHHRAIDLEPALGRDARLLADVAAAADDAVAWKAALRVASLLEGPEGPDVLFAAWSSTTNVTDKTTLAKKLLELKLIQQRMSPALLVAVELRVATTCEARRALLPRATSHGDVRARLPLYKMKGTTGCGPTGREDCNACMRGDGALDRALEAVAGRAAPTYYAMP